MVYLNMFLLAALPVCFVTWFDTNPLFNVLYIMCTCCVWLKGISYHHVLFDVRLHSEKIRDMGKKETSIATYDDLPHDFGLTRQVAEDVILYPSNLSLK